MKAMTPVLVSGGNSHSHFPVAARFLGLLFAGFLLVGCVSTYEAPQHVTEPAMLGGDVLYRASEEELVAVLKELELKGITNQPPADKAYAPLDADIFRHLTSKKFLLPGRDCFSMVYAATANDLDVLLGSGRTEYCYDFYNPICIDVEAGHHYQVKPAYFGRKDGRFLSPRWRDHYQVWDLTDDRLLLEISRRDLGLIMTCIDTSQGPWPDHDQY
jgi:hypothetical protein